MSSQSPLPSSSSAAVDRSSLSSRLSELLELSPSQLITQMLKREYQLSEAETSELHAKIMQSTADTAVSSSSSASITGRVHSLTPEMPLNSKRPKKSIETETEQTAAKEPTSVPMIESPAAEADSAPPIPSVTHSSSLPSQFSSSGARPRGTKKPQKPFDFSKYQLRHIALKFLYLGEEYHGFASQTAAERTVEDELFRALIRVCLIESRDTAHYSRCGRTDKGVSAGGQVIALYLRSKLKNPNALGIVPPHILEAERKLRVFKQENGEIPYQEEERAKNEEIFSVSSLSAPAFKEEIEIDPVSPDDEEELDYCGMLNKVLPPTIRVLAWQPVPLTFSARFSCTHRVYKYFFFADGMNIAAMHQAAQKLIGAHDFRNFCKVDPANAIHFIRRLEYFHVKYCDQVEKDKSSDAESSGAGKGITSSALCLSSPTGTVTGSPSDRWAEIEVRGNAFLYHQVRCMAQILFLIGRGLESPTVIDDLLDIQKMPNKPTYNLAPETPLVLYDSVFPLIEPTLPLALPSLEKSLEDWPNQHDHGRPKAYPNAPVALQNLQQVHTNLHHQWRELALKARLYESMIGQIQQNIDALRRVYPELQTKMPVPNWKSTGKLGKYVNAPRDDGEHQGGDGSRVCEGLKGFQLTPLPHTMAYNPHIPLNKRPVEKSYDELKESLTGKKMERNQRIEAMSAKFRDEFIRKFQVAQGAIEKGVKVPVKKARNGSGSSSGSGSESEGEGRSERQVKATQPTEKEKKSQ